MRMAWVFLTTWVVGVSEFTYLGPRSAGWGREPDNREGPGGDCPFSAGAPLGTFGAKSVFGGPMKGTFGPKHVDSVRASGRQRTSERLMSTGSTVTPCRLRSSTSTLG